MDSTKNKTINVRVSETIKHGIQLIKTNLLGRGDATDSDVIRAAVESYIKPEKAYYEELLADPYNAALNIEQKVRNNELMNHSDIKFLIVNLYELLQKRQAITVNSALDILDFTAALMKLFKPGELDESYMCGNFGSYKKENLAETIAFFKKERFDGKKKTDSVHFSDLGARSLHYIAVWDKLDSLDVAMLNNTFKPFFKTFLFASKRNIIKSGFFKKEDKTFAKNMSANNLFTAKNAGDISLTPVTARINKDGDFLQDQSQYLSGVIFGIGDKAFIGASVLTLENYWRCLSLSELNAMHYSPDAYFLSSTDSVLLVKDSVRIILSKEEFDDLADILKDVFETDQIFLEHIKETYGYI
jgi:hypothetical protein